MKFHFLETILHFTLWSFVAGMFHRKDQTFEEQPGNTFLNNVADLFTTNTLSAKRSLSLLKSAEKIGGKGLKHFNKLKLNANTHRNLLRKMCKGSTWPPVYNIQVRLWNLRTGAEEIKFLPILLPHEVLHALATHNDYSELNCKDGFSSGSLAHLQSTEASLHIHNAQGLGVWLDGCPCNWDRTESLEVMTLSLPGLTLKNKTMRIPLAMVPKRHQVKQNTWDDILKVMAWSFEIAALGIFPHRDHMGMPFAHFRNNARWRVSRAGKDLQACFPKCC